jgi:hypothetical protein
LDGFGHLQARFGLGRSAPLPDNLLNGNLGVSLSESSLLELVETKAPCIYYGLETALFGFLLKCLFFLGNLTFLLL